MEVEDNGPDTRQFHAHEWIRAGQTYPTDCVPEYISTARDRALRIPDNYVDLIPKPNLPIATLLQRDLPKQSNVINMVKPTAWFSQDLPTVDGNFFLQRAIPDLNVLAALEKAFGQRWFDGCRSIVDPRFNDGSERLPLWTLTAWRTLSYVVAQADRWRKAIKWMEKQAETRPDLVAVVAQIHGVFDWMGWDAPVTLPDFSITSVSFATFLSHEWLDDNHINMMMHDIQLRLLRHPENGARITTLEFASEIAKDRPISAFKRLKSGAILRRIEKEVKEKRLTRLYFPFNVNQNHWVAGCVDFSRKVISYGDSLYSRTAAAEKFLGSLRKWLMAMFDIDPVNKGNALACGRQTDSFSCGPATANTIEHNIFGDGIWDAGTASRDRMQWFLRVARRWTEVDGGGVGVGVGKSGGDDGDREKVESGGGNDKKDGESQDVVMASFENDISTAASNNERMGDASPTQGLRVSVSSLLNPAPEDSAAGNLAAHEADTFTMSSSDEYMDSSTAGSETSDDDGEESEYYNHDGSICDRADLKRPILDISDTSDSEDSCEKSSKPTVKKARLAAGAGHSKAAKHSLKKRQQLREGTLKVIPFKLRQWKDSIRCEDPHVQFDDTNIRRVRHSSCGDSFLVKEVYDLTRWRSHLKDCRKKMSDPSKISKKKASVSNTKPITSFFSKAPSKSSRTSESVKAKAAAPVPLSASSPPEPHACPGLSKLDDPRITRYLHRVCVSGGGGESIHQIAMKRFSKKFSALTRFEKDTVYEEQWHTHTWRVDQRHCKIFATQCKKLVADPGTDNRTLPCDECFTVLKSNKFRRVLRTKKPDVANQKYLNTIYRGGAIADIYARCVGLQDLLEAPDARDSPYVRYACGVLNGTYDDKIFNGLVDAWVQQRSREERGVGNQGFKYSAEYDSFCHNLSIDSPAAYRNFRKFFPGPSQRTFQRRDAKEARFSMGISDTTFSSVSAYLQSIGYTGTANLSCDDSKARKALRLMFDKKEDAWYLIGGIDGPIRVLDPDNMRELLEENVDKMATKLRLWCLTLNVPKMAPIIVAAEAISDNMDANSLAPLSIKILEGLITHGIKVVSYACDGTEVERAVQRIITDSAPRRLTYKVKNPHDRGRDLEIIIPVIKDQPVAMIQDSKHALKTMRNNLFSGGRLLVLGDHVALYDRIRDIAMNEEGSPLYVRDVDKLDRQDDNAATRLFSAEMLDYLAKNHPDLTGEIVYLFVFGELIDAYQNRAITHEERVKIVLRTQFFLEAWMAQLDHCGYDRKKYAPSRESLDILSILVEGYLALLFIHRDHTGGVTPFIPWLHSSEACEHCFGESRRIVKDFTILDFIFMCPKLRSKMRYIVLQQETSDAKARASGYAHTYFDMTGINELNLATFPSNEAIETAALEAAEESDSLVRMLGLYPERLRTLCAQSQSNEGSALPPIRAWFKDTIDERDEEVSGYDQSESGSCEAQTLLDLVEKSATMSLNPSKEQERNIDNLTSAALALAAEDSMSLNAFVHETIDNPEKGLAHDYSQVRSFETVIKSLVLPDTHSHPLGAASAVNARDLDFSALVYLRRQHETRQAAQGIRKRGNILASDNSEQDGKATGRQRLIHRFNQVLREVQGDYVAVGTGLERKARWTQAAKGGQTVGAPEVTGNSANAIAVATTTATNNLAKREKLFRQFRVPQIELLIHGRVTALNPLKNGQFAFVFTDTSVYLGKVLTFYAKASGANAKHEWASESSNISAVSNIAVKIYEYIGYRNRSAAQFTAKATKTAQLQVGQFALLPPQCFLTLLINKPLVLEGDADILELTTQDEAVFTSLKAGSWSIKEAIAAFSKRGPRVQK